MRATLLLVMLSSAFGETKLPPSTNRKIDFEKDIQPVLSQKCYSCHGEDAQQSGLRLDKRQNALRGGDYGPVIIPGKSAESKLIRRLVNGDGGLQMPPTGPLSDEEIGILRAWRKGPGAGGPGNRKRYLVLSLAICDSKAGREPISIWQYGCGRFAAGPLTVLPKRAMDVLGREQPCTFRPSSFGFASRCRWANRIDDWRICWFGGWDKYRVFFVVMVEREFDQPVAPCNARVSRFRVSTQMLTKVDLARLQES